ncbi:hypothetical protein PybrP1_011038 [[Pythium] brassicae (nom. inval.)]|nr:hypothetical protein PybrP1_011038 [[Pythium] brassicae (nom. inval.)]
MGTAPSLERVLRSIEDETLIAIIEDAYHVDPQRLERAFAIAKMRYVETTKEQLAREGSAHSEAESASASTHAALSAFGAPPPSSSSSAPPLLTSKEIGAMMSAGVVDDHPMGHHHESARSGGTLDDTVLNVGKDPMNALWNFDGHTLRELLPLDKNPQHASAGDSDEAGALAGKQLDDDGNPLMYGSCGRDKRYARCSVCYFRGLRCNSAHYCSCCQRPVCIRPRKYPNEEHPKICWNVLHMDKDMVSRVEKKKRRRLQAVAVAAATTSGSAAALKAEAAAFASSQRHPAAGTGSGTAGGTEVDGGGLDI